MLNELKETRDKINALNDEANKLFNKTGVLGTEYKKKLRKYIKENDVLNKYKWIFSVDRQSKPYLYSSDVDDDVIGQLILDGGWAHYSMDLEHSAVFHSNDGELSICFTEEDHLTKFVKDWNIKVDYSDINKDIKELEDKLSILKALPKLS